MYCSLTFYAFAIAFANDTKRAEDRRMRYAELHRRKASGKAEQKNRAPVRLSAKLSV